MQEAIYHLRLSKSGLVNTLPKPDPSRCIWAAKYRTWPYEEIELFCLIPSDEGRYCDGVCGDYIEKCEGEV